MWLFSVKIYFNPKSFPEFSECSEEDIKKILNYTGLTPVELIVGFIVAFIGFLVIPDVILLHISIDESGSAILRYPITMLLMYVFIIFRLNTIVRKKVQFLVKNRTST